MSYQHILQPAGVKATTTSACHSLQLQVDYLTKQKSYLRKVLKMEDAEIPAFNEFLRMTYVQHGGAK